MRTSNFTITIHMVSSLDGFIAKHDDSVSWFETGHDYQNGRADEDPAEFMKSVDCFVMGARTYEQALALSNDFGWPYGDVPTIVLTGRPLPPAKPNIETFAGDLESFVQERLRPRFRNVWLVGGASVVQEFVRLKLADEIRLSILPILLGSGKRFLEQTGDEQVLQLERVTANKRAMVELYYRLK